MYQPAMATWAHQGYIAEAFLVFQIPNNALHAIAESIMGLLGRKPLPRSRKARATTLQSWRLAESRSRGAYGQSVASGTPKGG